MARAAPLPVSAEIDVDALTGIVETLKEEGYEIEVVFNKDTRLVWIHGQGTALLHAGDIISRLCPNGSLKCKKKLF